jgi:transposase-like protein
VVDTGRRRRWSEEEKLRIVAEELSTKVGDGMKG